MTQLSPYAAPGVCKRPRPSKEYIRKVVCEYFGIPEDCLAQKIRAREILVPRQIYITLCVENKYSNSEACRSVTLNHATGIHAKKVVSDLYDTDHQFRTDMQILRLKLN